MRILVVEDESELRKAISRYMRGIGHAVDECDSCRSASAAVEVYEHDVIVLDRMLPDGDSIKLLDAWRTKGLTTPVIFLTARDSVDDRVGGLESGADDYLVKPFAMAELAARIATLSRRGNVAAKPVMNIGPLSIDRGRREVRRDGVLIPLRPKEFTLLELLVSRMGQVVSKHRIIDTCWDETRGPMSNVEEALVASLRRKLGKPNLIRTIRGSGYMLEERRESES
ncbi:MAG: response regulator transcription factor [Planctomycetota bacterium]